MLSERKEGRKEAGRKRETKETKGRKKEKMPTKNCDHWHALL